MTLPSEAFEHLDIVYLTVPNETGMVFWYYKLDERAEQALKKVIAAALAHKLYQGCEDKVKDKSSDRKPVPAPVPVPKMDIDAVRDEILEKRTIMQMIADYLGVGMSFAEEHVFPFLILNDELLEQALNPDPLA